MEIGGRVRDMTGVIAANYRRLGLDALVCIGGGGTHKNALRLVEKGLHIITLPKTIDNDVALTDATIGFDTALGIATEALDRLHSTAHSHHRIVMAEIMGHRAGWLTLGAGIAGGADVILIPEIPYDVEKVVGGHPPPLAERHQFQHRGGGGGRHVEARCRRLRRGGAPAQEGQRPNWSGSTPRPSWRRSRPGMPATPCAWRSSSRRLTHLEARVTILGYVQRGGTPSVADRLLATRLGTACAGFIHEGVFGVMVAARGDGVKAVPIEEVAGKLKTVAATTNGSRRRAASARASAIER